jgi:uncharacterized tellurite resistance protein B-like protein
MMGQKNFGESKFAWQTNRLIGDYKMTKPPKGKKHNQLVAENARKAVDDILAKVHQPDGYAKLSSYQRRFLLAAILGSIVPADLKVRDVEMQRLKTHLATKFHLTPELLEQALAAAQKGLSGEELTDVSKTLPELLSIEDRINLIALLWDVAMCDLELAPEEEKMVMRVADLAQVPRKHVVEQQQKVQRKGYAS